MSSRMEKYESESTTPPSRSEKNKDLYQNVNKSEISRFKTYNNATVIDEGAKDIDLNKIKNYVDALNSSDSMKKRRSLLEDKGLYEQKPTLEEQTKDYDINSILDKARETREKDYEQDKYKKLRDTQFDILSKLKVMDDGSSIKDDKFNTEEKTLINLINTVADNKNKNDLLSELQEEKEELEKENKELFEELQKTKEQEKMKDFITEEVSKELSKKENKEQTKPNVKEVDDTFFTNSLSFSKEDFDDGEKTSSSFGLKLGIFFLIMLIIIIIIGILYFVFQINVIEYVKENITKLINKFMK